MKAVLDIQGVSHSYGPRTALKNVSFSVPAGGVTMLLGPNGAGKTTLFSLICRLLPLKSGQIALCGRDLAGSGDDILADLGLVFQQQTLDLDLTVEQNLAYHAALHGLPRTAARERMRDAFSRLDLETRSAEKVRTLSGGHRRRVEIARALMTRPKLLVLDEPTVGLDIPTRKSLVAFLHDLAVTDAIAVLWATHLADEAAGGDDAVILSRGEVKASGRVADIIEASGQTSLDATFAALTGEPVAT